jgi:hypothetical protein
MAAVGELVRCTNGSWMVRPPERCPRGHRLAAGVGPATGLGIHGRRYLPSHWPDDNMLPKCGSTG